MVKCKIREGVFSKVVLGHRCKKGWNVGTMFPEIIWAGRNILEDYQIFHKLYIYLKYNVEDFVYEATISHNFSIFEIFSGIFGVIIDYKTVEN